MDKDGFIKALYEKWRDEDWMDIDGGDLDTLMKKHGLTVERPITEEEAKTEWAAEWDMEPGDMGNFASDELKAILGD